MKTIRDLNQTIREKIRPQGFNIPQKICPFLVWNTELGYLCYEDNDECGGCRFVGYTTNEDETLWEWGLQYDPYMRHD